MKAITATLAPDVMQFGQGAAFIPSKVPELLGLTNEDVSRLSGVAVSSLRYDDAIPAPLRDRLEELANTINMVATLFSGDVNKTAAWFKAVNPMLGDISPKDMIRLGRHERLRKFINGRLLGRSTTFHSDFGCLMAASAIALICK